MITFYTVTGRRLDLGKPSPADIAVIDIATALSKLCRYTGQVEAFYSVAQHECLVADLVDPYLAFPALHHDDSEAYLGDMSSKLKHAPFMAGYRHLEGLWATAIDEAFDIRLTPEERHHIKVADDLAAIFERVVLRYRRPFTLQDIALAVEEEWITRSSVAEMTKLASRLPKNMTSLSPEVAKVLWVTSHARLGVRWREGVRA